MNLTPLAAPPRPAYPSHRRRQSGLGAWVRRVAVAAGASSVLWLGGCYGVSPFGEADPEPPSTIVVSEPLHPVLPVPEWPDDIAGGARAPGFACEAPPSYADWHVPAYLDGQLCGLETAWAQVVVDSAAPHVVELLSGAGSVVVVLLSPEGAPLAELDGDGPRVEVFLSPGLHLLAATPVDPATDGHAWFEVRVDLAP